MMFDFPGIRVAACLTLSSLVASSCAMAQVVQAQNAAVTAPSPVDRAAVGDAPDDPGPLAHDLSARLKPTDIHAAMKKVADWQLRVAKPKFNPQWTFAALYDGFLAGFATTGDPRYREAVLRFAEQQHWKLLNDRFPHADGMALGQAYLDLYLSDPPV